MIHTQKITPDAQGDKTNKQTNKTPQKQQKIETDLCMTNLDIGIVILNFITVVFANIEGFKEELKAIQKVK